MRFSDDKINYLSHVFFKALNEDEDFHEVPADADEEKKVSVQQKNDLISRHNETRQSIDFNVDDLNQVRLSIKEALIASFQHFDELEEKIRTNLSSRKSKMIEGSREWDEEYRRLYEEEIGKLKAV